MIVLFGLRNILVASNWPHLLNLPFFNNLKLGKMPKRKGQKRQRGKYLKDELDYLPREREFDKRTRALNIPES